MQPWAEFAIAAAACLVCGFGLMELAVLMDPPRAHITGIIEESGWDLPFFHGDGRCSDRGDFGVNHLRRNYRCPDVSKKVRGAGSEADSLAHAAHAGSIITSRFFISVKILNMLSIPYTLQKNYPLFCRDGSCK